jgi:prepilin-type N-terminal cleavage/methylation domain-containing protein
MAQNKTRQSIVGDPLVILARRGLSLVEMVVTVLILSMLMGYAWKIFFGGRETMRHTVSQSQMQAEVRWFFDQLAKDIATAYRFYAANPTEKKFGFYAFAYARTPLDMIYYDYSAGGKAIAVGEQAFNCLRVEYTFDPTAKTVKRAQTPGKLKFQKVPMVFTADTSGNASPEDQAKEKIMVHNISDFDFVPYEQVFERKPDPSDPTKIQQKSKITPIDGTDATKVPRTTFLSLRVHNLISESGDRRDEELDLVVNLYRRIRLMDACFPGYFSSTDENGWY